jgi:hypothetical protein
MPARVCFLALLLLLAGCKLIDQTTFAPAPEAPPPAPPPPRHVSVDPRIPLVTIDFSNQNPEYRGPLGYAVRAAETRNPNVRFDVTSVVNKPEDAAQGQQEAAAVMKAIAAQGVPASRIHLALTMDPSQTGRQVRVYVR